MSDSAPDARPIPVCEPLLDDAAARNVLECLETGWISSQGEFITRFERAWASYCGMPHGVAVSNGTAALELAMAALRLEAGDEVILPTFTIVSCAAAVIRGGGVPVLVDSEPGTWCMDVEQVAARITPRTAAIMPVHMFGHPVDMDPIHEMAQARDIAIVEDAAQAHGAEYRGRRCGGLSDMSCFSFYANKIVTTGEGGMVLTRSRAHADHLRSLRDLCFSPERRFVHEELGFNYRLTNLQAALGVAQLEGIADVLRRKRALAARYRARLGGRSDLDVQREALWARSSNWMFGVVLADHLPLDASGLAERLRERGIHTRPFFWPMHEQPALRARGLFRGESYPVASRLARRGLYLPSGPTLTDAQVDQVCAAMEETLTVAAR
jgi:perosamine synthetase